MAGDEIQVMSDSFVTIRRLLVLALCALVSSSVAVSAGREEAQGEGAEMDRPEGMISIETDEYIFYARESGDRSNEPVLLLHGFPETSAMWTDLQGRLADSGFYSIAPDQRGYSPNARPGKRDAYTIEKLAGDVIAIADALGLERFHLVGHDWGSAVGWTVAANHPDRVISWTAMSVPHPVAFGEAIRNDKAQYTASGYMRLFRWALLPEFFLKIGDYKNLRTVWEEMPERLITEYLNVLTQPGALTAAIDWYRANYASLAKGLFDLGPVSVPTLFIWGRNDPAILEFGVNRNGDYVAGPYTEKRLDAGHWLIQEAYVTVSELIMEHISKNTGMLESTAGR
jgi:pimeloyl-ACP methyl ester carboxylesterase